MKGELVHFLTVSLQMSVRGMESRCIRILLVLDLSETAARLGIG